MKEFPSPSPCPNPYSVSVVIPCYNEAARFNIAAFRAFLEIPGPVRFIFVDDGSKDKTLEVLAKTSAGFESRASVVRSPVNEGKAEAVRRGLSYAFYHFRPEFVGYWDADLATPLDAIPRLLGEFQKRPGISMVFGARVQLLGRTVKRQPYRHYLGRVFATVVSHVLRLPIYDTQCGAKLFRVDAFMSEILKEPFLSKWIFDVEIIARYIQRHNQNSALVEGAIYEYPLEHWEDIAGSKVHPKDFFIAFADILRIRSKYLRPTSSHKAANNS